VATMKERELRYRYERTALDRFGEGTDKIIDLLAARDQLLVDAVKRYATDNYERDGMDYIETMTDDDISEAIGGARTVKGAVFKVKERVSARVAMRAEVAGGSDDFLRRPDGSIYGRAKEVRTDYVNVVTGQRFTQMTENEMEAMFS